MLSVQSPTSSLCVSPPAQTEGEKEKRGDSHRRNNYTALRGDGTCVTPVNKGPWQDRE